MIYAILEDDDWIHGRYNIIAYCHTANQAIEFVNFLNLEYLEVLKIRNKKWNMSPPDGVYKKFDYQPLEEAKFFDVKALKNEWMKSLNND